MTAAEVQKVIAVEAMECGSLYEILWELNTHFPNVSYELKLAMSQQVLGTMLNEHFVVLVKGDSTAVPPLPLPLAHSTIGNAKNWEPPGHGHFVMLAAKVEANAI